jgi:hypothetical protein
MNELSSSSRQSPFASAPLIVAPSVSGTLAQSVVALVRVML